MHDDLKKETSESQSALLYAFKLKSSVNTTKTEADKKEQDNKAAEFDLNYFLHHPCSVM